MATTITDSNYITKLDSAIVADLCAGLFTIDVTPSTFVPSGEGYVEGASVKITNPVGVVIRDYITSGYDIVPPMTGSVSISIPLVASNYIYGNYIVSVRLTDADGDEYVVTKTVNVCQPDKKNKTKKEGCLDVSIQGNCKEGKVVFMVDAPPVYKALVSSSQVNTLQVEYPTSSGLPVVNSTLDSFSLMLFEGIYKVTGDVCATYVGTDNISYKIKYKVKCEKNIKCKIDECCIQAAIEELNDKSKAACTQEEKDDIASTILNVLWLVNAANGAANCGNDPSEFITSLEEILGCTCTCNCNEGTPIINNTPNSDVTISGCMVDESTAGETTAYVINPVPTALTPLNNLITVSDPVFDEDTCQFNATIDLNASSFGVTCESLDALFSNSINPQNNTVLPNTYRILTTGCEKISPPTGYAVLGAERMSAYGKMEWFDTLTLANEAAIAFETVLIYKNDPANLVITPNVNYQGIGEVNIGSMSLTTDVASVNMISNIKCLGFTSSGAGIKTVTLSNVVVTGVTTISTNSKISGGVFNNNVDIIGLTMAFNGQLKNAFITTKISMTANALLSHSIIEDSAAFDGYPAIFLNNTSGVADTLCQLTNCYITSLNNEGVNSITGSANEKVVISNNTIRTGARIGLQVHTGGVLSAGGSIISHNTITNVGPYPALKLYNVYAPLTDPLENPNNYAVSYNMAYSQTGAGIQSVLGTMKNCYGYSADAAGILIDSQENKGSQMAIVDCVGESKNSSGLIANRDIYISGGTYISRLNTSAGYPIQISNSSQNALAPHYYYITGVKTIARNTTAYAIKANTALTVKIAGNIFLNEKLNTVVPGIDPSITLVAVIIDAYGNIS